MNEKPDVTLYKPGTVVRNRINTDLYGTIHKSEDGSGFEVRVYDPHVEGVQTSPTAQRRSVIARFWELVEMPKLHTHFSLGGIRKLTVEEVMALIEQGIIEVSEGIDFSTPQEYSVTPPEPLEYITISGELKL